MINHNLFEKVKHEYISNSVCMGDLMEDMNIGDYSLEDIFDTILALKVWADGDIFYRLLGTNDFSLDNLEKVTINK